MARKRKPAVGDRVAFRLIAVAFDDPTPLKMPTVAGTVVAVPTDVRNRYYEVQIDPTTLPNPAEVAGIEHLQLSDILGILPQSMSRTDVEAWLAEP